MADGSTYVQDRLDLFAFEGLVLAGLTPSTGIVLAPGSQHRCPPCARPGVAHAERWMPAGAPRVKMGRRPAIRHHHLQAAAGSAHEMFVVT
jgi:hypothetical protein